MTHNPHNADDPLGPAAEGPADPGGAPAPVTLREATKVWGYVGLNSFGGPAGQIAVMHREVVDNRRWLSEARFLHALNYCMVLPGPEAQQLATYVGWLMHGVRGGAIAGSLFVIPGVVVMMVLSIIYAVYGQVGWVAGALFGLQAAVVAIVIQAVIRVGRRTLHSPILRMVAALAFVALFFFAVPFPLVILVAGVAGWLVGRGRPAWIPTAGHQSAAPADQRPHLLPDDEAVDPVRSRGAFRAAALCLVLWLVPVVALVVLLGTDNIFTQQSILFSKTAVITFGGAYAVLAYVSQQAVQTYGWISAGDMVAGLGLAETTPGPLIMVVQFVGFLAAYNNPGDLPPLLAGALGASITVWVTFLPCFFFIFLGAPYVERLRHSHALRHALTGIGAAVVGVILNLALWFALTTAFAVVDLTVWGPVQVSVPDWASVIWPSVAITVLAVVLVFRFQVATVKVLATCAAVGVATALTGLT
jgi:chromate transporter